MRRWSVLLTEFEAQNRALVKKQKTVNAHKTVLCAFVFICHSLSQRFFIYLLDYVRSSLRLVCETI